jgi:hypothetical protein
VRGERRRRPKPFDDLDSQPVSDSPGTTALAMNAPGDPTSLEVQWTLARRLPAPRPVRRRKIVWFVYAVYFAVFVAFPSFAAWKVGRRVWMIHELKSRGVATVGRVVESRTARGDDEATTYVDYEFVVDGRTYRFQTSRSGWHPAFGQEAEVVYLPGNPAVATSKADLGVGLMDTDEGFLAIMGGVLGGLGIPFGFFFCRPYRRHRRLMIGGALGEATVDEVKPLPEDRFYVMYTFRALGAMQHGRVVVDAAGAERMQPGQTLAMLYDPHNPAESDFLFAAIESCLIVPDIV